MTGQVHDQRTAFTQRLAERWEKDPADPCDDIMAEIREFNEANHAEDSMEGAVGDRRRKMPDDRESLTFKLQIDQYDFYVTAGMYEDGTLGEIFVRGAGKEGSTSQGYLDAFATMFSIGLQYGAELDVLARKFAHLRFEPRGHTGNAEIPYVQSPIDYIMRWLALRFGSPELRADLEKIANELRAVG